MTMAWRALVDGAGRVLRAPAVLAGMFLLSVLLAAPAGGPGAGVEMPGWERHMETATGLEQPFTLAPINVPTVVAGMGHVIHGRAAPTVAGLTVLSLAAWLFLQGGLIDRLARNRPTRAPGFFAACGTYFLRFVRLGLVGAAGYALIAGATHGLLPGGVDDGATSVVVATVFGALLVTWTLMLDYAKVRAVVEDRHSMLGALLAGSRFALRHPMKTGLLWALNAAALLGLMSVAAFLVPAGPETGATAWSTVAAGQVYVVARLFLKLVGYASQVSLFQAMLTRSAYTDEPLPEWPDAPSADATR